MTTNNNKLFHDAALSQLEEQEQRRRATDTKAIRLGGMTVALVSVTAILLKDFSGTPQTLSHLSICLVVLIGIASLGVFACILWVLMPQEWFRDPDLRDFLSALRDPEYKDRDLTQWAGRQFANAVEKNEKALNDKIGRVKFALGGLTALSLLLVALAVSLVLT